MTVWEHAGLKCSTILCAIAKGGPPTCLIVSTPFRPCYFVLRMQFRMVVVLVVSCSVCEARYEKDNFALFYYSTDKDLDSTKPKGKVILCGQSVKRVTDDAMIKELGVNVVKIEVRGRCVWRCGRPHVGGCMPTSARSLL